MFPSEKKSGFIVAYQANGLNGFWRKLAQKLVGIALGMVREVPVVGNFIADEITSRISAWMASNGQSHDMGRTAADYDPTPSEESLITNWNASQFAPFYKILATELAAGLNQGSVTAQIAAINIAFAKMMVVRDWHKTNNTAGLSASAVAWRTEYIVTLFQPLFDKIADVITPYQYDETAMWLPAVKSVMSQELPLMNYAPLISGIPSGLIVHQYFIRGYAPNTPMLPGYDGGSTVIPNLPPATEPPIVTPTNPNVPSVPKPIAPAVAKPQNFLQKNKVMVIGGALLALAFLPEDKKKKKKD